MVGGGIDGKEAHEARRADAARELAWVSERKDEGEGEGERKCGGEGEGGRVKGEGEGAGEGDTTREAR